LQSLSEALGLSEVADHGRGALAGLLAEKDRKLLAWCDEAASHLQNAVCIIENLLDPRTIVIGGSAPTALVKHLVALAEPLHRSVRGGVALPGERIVLSERQEDSSILGAAVLPIYEMLSPRFELLQQGRKSDLNVAGLLGQGAMVRAGRL